jgi:hypothetical protein
MSTSQKQLAANRRNAQASTGPRTPEGKHTVAHNAISHGIFARDVVAFRAESAEDFHALRAALLGDLQPEGALEELLVEQIATLHWRQRRVLRAEAAAIDSALARPTDGSSEGRTRVIVESLLAINGLGGSQALYGAAVAQGLRRDIETTAEGQAVLLAALQRARASLDGDDPLPASVRHPLGNLLDPGSELTHLLQSLDSDAPADPAPSLQAVRDVLDRSIARAEAHLAALRDRQEEEDRRLSARLSLPPDAQADKILRYDKTLGSALARALAELHRLQTARRVRKSSESVPS